MISLFLDTATDYRTIAVLKDQAICKIYHETKGDLSEQLLPIIEQMFQELKLLPSQVDRIYIVIGPGSFTGIRLGLTIAKIYAWAMKKTLIPISSLECLATTPSETDFIVPLIDARRGYVYGAIYDQKGKCIVSEQYNLLSELLKQIPKDKSYCIVSYDNFQLDQQQIPHIDLEALVMRHANDTGVNVHTIKPNYLKKTEAEENIHKNKKQEVK